MKISQLINQNPQSTPGTKWIIFHSKKLDERIILIADKKYLKEARCQFPELAIYFRQEIEELWNAWQHDHKNDESIKTIHAMKKEFMGWVIPPNTQQ